MEQAAFVKSNFQDVKECVQTIESQMKSLRDVMQGFASQSLHQQVADDFFSQVIIEVPDLQDVLHFNGVS